MSSFACGGRSTKGCVGMKERLGWRGWLWLCYPGLRSAVGKMMWKGSEEEKTEGKLRSGDVMEESCFQIVKEDECSTRFSGDMTNPIPGAKFSNHLVKRCHEIGL